MQLIGAKLNEKARWNIQTKTKSHIPNAYKALMTYMAINGIKEKHDPAILSCYEHEYFNNHGVKFMDIYIAIE